MTTVKLHWSRQGPNGVENKPGYVPEGLDCHIQRNGRFYGFARVCKCHKQPRQPQTYYVEVLIPGSHNFLELTGGGQTYDDAKANARKIAEQIIADLQNIVLQ